MTAVFLSIANRMPVRGVCQLDLVSSLNDSHRHQARLTKNDLPLRWGLLGASSENLGLQRNKETMKETSALPEDLPGLAVKIRACQLCAEHLEHGIRRVLQVHGQSRILIAGQAPGRRVHESGVPFDDPSGERLRSWLRVDAKSFYDSEQFAILPMGFCFPGTGKSGDLPPRPECAPAWRDLVLNLLPNIGLTILIGRYAIDWHLHRKRDSLATIVGDSSIWDEGIFPLPHPSPRNNIWLKKNAWFEQEVLPTLRQRVASLLK